MAQATRLPSLCQFANPFRPHPRCTSIRNPPLQSRAASTTRRSRKMLNLAPAPAHGGPLTISGATGRSKTAQIAVPAADHIIHNPPPSAPNVYHTPGKFLPKDDIRYKLLQQAAQREEAAAAAATAAAGKPLKKSEPPLPTPVRTPYVKRYHVTPDQIEEIRRLKAEDEDKWTVNKLAQRFQCSTTLIMVVARASLARKERLKRELDESLKSWRRRGVVSPKTRAERRRRQDLWGVEA